jgi:isopentenyl-diphosphate delta-isomerase type 1
MPLDPRNEPFYWVDENDNELGCIPRYIAHADKNLIHRAVGIIILNEDDEMLLQQRSYAKDMDPGIWSYGVGGHVTYGQNYEEAALRELEEEMGIKNVPLKTITRFLSVMDEESEYYTLFEAHVPTGISIFPDPDEVGRIAWVHTSKLPDFFQENPPKIWTVKDLQLAGYL